MRDRIKDISFAALRVTSGVILAAHGWKKLTGLQDWQQQLQSLGVFAPDVTAYFAIAGELLGGLGLIVGLLTPIAAFGTACTSAAAIILVHAGNGLFAQNGGFEYPLTLLMVSLLFIAHGGGALSLDAGIKRARASGEEPRTSTAPGRAPWHDDAHAHGR